MITQEQQLQFHLSLKDQEKSSLLSQMVQPEIVKMVMDELLIPGGTPIPQVTVSVYHHLFCTKGYQLEDSIHYSEETLCYLQSSSVEYLQHYQQTQLSVEQRRVLSLQVMISSALSWVIT